MRFIPGGMPGALYTGMPGGAVDRLAAQSSTKLGDVPKTLEKHVRIFSNGLLAGSRRVRSGGGWVGGNG